MVMIGGDQMTEKLINIPKQNIQLEFKLEDQSYVLLSEFPELDDDVNMYFAKLDILEDGTRFIRNIESDEEYEKVLNVYNTFMNNIGDSKDDE